MIRILTALLVFTGSAEAQTAPPPKIDNMIAKVRAYLDDEELAKIKAIVSGIVSSPAPSVSVTNITRSCEEGWTLVSTGSGYKCARELRDPK